MLFEDNITVSFSMEAFTSLDGRRTQVMHGLCDIVGDMSSFKHTDFRTGKVTGWNRKPTDMAVVTDASLRIGYRPYPNRIRRF